MTFECDHSQVVGLIFSVSFGDGDGGDVMIVE